MNVQTVHFVSTSVADTIQLGTYLGQLLQRGDVILLAGDLGAGKTHFSKGVVAGIGSSDSVTSPTFVFINEYRGPQRLPIFHADLYRINTPAELIGIGITDATDGHGICIVEWPERDPSLRDMPHIAIHIAHVDQHTRRISVNAHGSRPLHIVTTLQHTSALQHMQQVSP
jgi:tRNA threonylcarbamoyladenosine biosynthesis protein TsaE